MRPGRGQRSAKLIERRSRKSSQGPLAAQKRIACHHAGSTGIRHNCQFLSGDAWPARESSAQSNRSLTSYTRTMPARSNAASYTLSTPANAPVCDAAAWADSVKRPALYATIGLVRVQARAADMKALAFSIDSTYRMIDFGVRSCTDSRSDRQT